ncbi:MAG: hypothetical protein EOM87_00860 [Clostridia bacterium]|nr:hypothetical protein [Clostridia bacterium]
MDISKFENKQRIFWFEFASLVFCLVFSVINHFIFEWTGESLLFAPFVPTNESVWEHSKLLFIPFLFFSIIEYFFLKDNKNFIFAKSLPLVVAIPLMITFFYTYSGILGFHVVVLDIMLSLTIVLLMNLVSYKILTCKKTYSSKILFALAIITFVLIILFTFIQPKIALFLDTTTGTYGIN